MRIHTKVVYSWIDDQLVAVEDEWVAYSGPVALCKGSSGDENTIKDQQMKMASTLQGDFGSAFSGQQSILKGLTDSLTKTMQSGPSQFGFSAGQLNALNTQATTGTATQYANARRAAGEAAAAAGGGNAFLPTGAANQTQAEIAAAAAQQESSQLLGIQQAGWNQGNANYNNSVSQLQNVANLQNPLGYATQTLGAQNSAFTGANIINKENNAADSWNAIGGALGGIAGSFAGPLGGMIGSKLGSALGGVASGASDGNLFGIPNPLGGGSPGGLFGTANELGHY